MDSIAPAHTELILLHNSPPVTQTVPDASICYVNALRGFVHSLGGRLMFMPNSDEADRLTRVYHQVVDEIHRIEERL